VLPLRGEPRIHAIRDSNPRRAPSFRSLAAPLIGRSYWLSSRKIPGQAAQTGARADSVFPVPGRLDIWLSVTVFIVLCGAVLAVPAAESAPAHRAATCSFPAGQHRLTIDASDLKTIVAIRRDGKKLALTQDGHRIGCGPDEPTVHNVNVISVSSRTEFRVDLGGGPLAPGFTNEGDRSSEIEIQAKFGRTGGLRVIGSRRKDRIVMGTSEGFAAVDLNGRERKRDADVFVGGGFPVLSVVSGRGRDRISARGGRGFDGPLDLRTTISSGSGRDRIKGGPLRDLIGSGAGPDRIAPGKGGDRIKSLGGSDRLRLKDGERDYARCGPGKDRVRADRKDRLSGCDKR
jgi:hypothetical protein